MPATVMFTYLPLTPASLPPLLYIPLATRGKIWQPKGVCAISGRLVFEVQRLRLYSLKEEAEEVEEVKG